MKVKSLFALAAAVSVAACALAESRLWVYRNDGTQVSFAVAELDSLSFAVLPDLSLVSSDSVRVPGEGGSFTVQVASNTSWTVVSDLPWCVPDLTEGEGDGSFGVTVSANSSESPDMATLTVASGGGLSLSVRVYRDGAAPAPVTDCQGNSYPTVRIGEQCWMAENLQCTQYDTESERAGATLDTSERNTEAPYYIDGRDTEFSHAENLTDGQRSELGLLYNWAAAMGYASAEEAEAQTDAYEGTRQGICPNGWHMPSQAEWETLFNYVTSQDANHKTAKPLKSTSGWYSNGNGTDLYGFGALPAGYACGSKVSFIGSQTVFWSSTAINSTGARGRFIHYDSTDLGVSLQLKDYGLSVRCVRN